MSNNNKFYILLAAAALCVFVAIVLLGPFSEQQNTDANLTASKNEIKEKTKSTIGTSWQWLQEDNMINDGLENNRLPFTADSVYRALQAVKLDENGNVILDHDALLSLDEALERIHNKLDSESLSVLQALIRKALPGKAGEQTAELVNDYYQFLQAKQEFSQINEAMADTNNELTAESIEANEMLYSELQELREVHIGSEATKKLFRISDANAQYMFDSMKLETNSELSAEEKQQRRDEIKERHVSLSINISDWPTRYQEFKKQKQRIVDSNIGQQQKQQRIESLLKNSFNEDELKRIAHLGLSRI